MAEGRNELASNALGGINMRRTKKGQTYRRPFTLPKIRESRSLRINHKIGLLRRHYGATLFSEKSESLIIPILRDEDRRRGVPLDIRTAINFVVEMAYSVFTHPDKTAKALQPLARMQLESLDILQAHLNRISKVKGNDYPWKGLQV